MRSTDAIRTLLSGLLVSAVLLAPGTIRAEGHHYASMDEALAAAAAAKKPLLVDFGTTW